MLAQHKALGQTCRKTNNNVRSCHLSHPFPLALLAPLTALHALSGISHALTATIAPMSTSQAGQPINPRNSDQPLPRAEMRDIVDISLWVGQLLLQNGADTERAEGTIHHLGTGLGCDWLDVLISPNAIVLTSLSGGEFRTRARRLVRFGGVDMNIVAKVNDLAYQVEAHTANRQKIRRELEEIDTMPKLYNRWLVVLLVGLACAAFSRLFGGDWAAFFLTWAAASTAMITRQELDRHYFNQYLIVVATAFVATVVAALGVLMKFGDEAQISLAASVLLLIPGVPLINASKDLLQGHMVTGIVRGVIGALIALSIALGIGIAITLLPLTFVRNEFVPPSNLLIDAFWAALAAIGFAVLFNVPYRTLPGCAAGGALGHAGRTFLLRSGWPGVDHIVAATLVGATIVGILAFLFARRQKLPSIIFAVSGAIPLVPGTFAYSVMLGILHIAGIIDLGTTSAVDQILFNQVIPNALTTAFILAALALGIAAPVLLFRRHKPVV